MIDCVAHYRIIVLPHYRIMKKFFLLSIGIILSFGLRAQVSNQDTTTVSYKALWKQYVNSNRAKVQSANILLDDIERKALQDSNTQQLFRVHYERTILNTQHNRNWDLGTCLQYLDSVKELTTDTAYRCLYDYFIGTLLEQMYQSGGASTASSIGLSDFSKWKEWAQSDLYRMAQQYLQNCFNVLESTAILATEDFSFLLEKTSRKYRNLRPTLFDLIVQHRIDNLPSNSQGFAPLIDRAIRKHDTTTERNIIIDYAIAKNYILHYPDKKNLDSNSFWIGLQQIEDQYGSDEAIDYARAYFLYDYATSPNINAPGFREKSHELFQKIAKESSNDYFLNNANFYLKEIEKIKLNCPSDAIDYAPSPKIILPIEYTNIDTLYLTIFKAKDLYHLFFKTVRTGGNVKYTIPAEIWKKLKKQEAQQQFVLPNPIPYESYSTELPIDSLGAGDYVLLFHLTPQCDTNNVIMMHQLEVTSVKLAYWGIGRKIHEAAHDRQTGKALTHKYIRAKWHIGSTDKYGEFSYRPSFFKTYNDKNSYVVKNKRKDACHFNELSMPSNYVFRRGYTNYPNSHIILDRTLYRPSQTLYFKAVMVHNGKIEANKTYVFYLKDYHSHIYDTLKLTTNEFGSVAGQFKIPANANGYYGIEGKLFTDKNAARHKRFRKYDRNGYISHQVSCLFTVSEYKLPTFEVKLLPYKEATSFGDTLFIRGEVKAFAGYPISNANVNVRVKYFGETFFLDTVSDENGQFVVQYVVPESDLFSYTCNVEAIVTDVNGETHSDKNSFTVYGHQLKLKLEEVQNIDLSQSDSLNWKVKVRNYSNQVLNVPVRLRVTRMEMPDTYLHYRYGFFEQPSHPICSEELYQQCFPHSTKDPFYSKINNWKIADTLLFIEQSFFTDSIFRYRINDWPQGQYRVELSATDSTITPDIQYFSIFNTQDNVSHRYEPVYVNLPKKAVIGDSLTIVVGSYLSDAWLYCDVFQGEKRICAFEIPADKSQHQLRVKTKAHGEYQINVVVRSVQSGHCFHQNAETLLLPRTELPKITTNILKLELTHWNRVLEPGHSDTWEISVKERDDNTMADAELVAGMVDASLGMLGMSAEQYWMSPFTHGERIPKSLRNYSYGKIRTGENNHKAITTTCSNPLHLKQKKYEQLRLPYSQDFIWSSRIQMNYSGPVTVRGNRSDGTATIIDGVRIREKSNASIEEVFQYEPPVFDADRTASGRSVTSALSSLEGVASMDGEISSVRGNKKTEETEKNEKAISEEAVPDNFVFSPTIRLRNNFTETAFFYPQLRTDAEGRVKIAFTIPDQYTKWRFFAMAHTRELHTGKLVDFVQTRRMMMIQSNAPRFLREGDTLNFSIKVCSTQDSTLRGKARLTLFNFDTDEPLVLFTNGTDSLQDFTCAARQSTVVNWQFVVPKGVEAIGYRVLAQSGNYGDGEENVLPVLPNRALVTEAKHFALPANATQTVTFEHILNDTSSTLQNYSYTFDLTTNPVWTAIAALPYLMEYKYECTDHLFHKLYANAIALDIVRQHPEIADVYAKWRTDSIMGESLSPLHQNENLKNIMLEETPWVYNAQREEDAIANHAKLMDSKRLQGQIDNICQKLSSRMLAKGGWGWYNHSHYSEYITNRVVAGYRKLQHLGIDVPNAKVTMNRAIRQMDSCAARKIRENEKHNWTFYISETDIQYLYARTFGKVDTSWLNQHYVQVILQKAVQDVYEANYTRQAEVALILFRIGRQDEAREIMEAIRQQAITHPELGMYWRNAYEERCFCHYFPWYEAPVERQALLIEAFTEIAPNKDELDAMKQWLLCQKHSNNWSNTSATSEAVYALLLNSSPETLSTAATTLTIDGQTFNADDDPDAAIGTGRITHTWKGENITTRLAEATVRTDSTHPAFGALYWQYFENLDKVAAAADGLQIERELYHRVASTDGPRLEPVTDDNPVRLGEKITVRIVIKSDRDLEFVHLKDQRASAFEPASLKDDVIYQNGFSYQICPHDASTNFFITELTQGTYVLEYDLIATQLGDFSHGIATIECLYAPEFRAQSRGLRVKVKEDK